MKAKQESILRIDEKESLDYLGHTIFVDSSIYDANPDSVVGAMNLIRMQQGSAPIGFDGQSVNIHHIDQTNESILIEMLQSQHREYYSLLHYNTGQFPSLIDRNAFGSWRQSYWKWRSSSIQSQ